MLSNGGSLLNPGFIVVIFRYPASPTNYYYHIKNLTIIICLPGHREHVMEDVREHEAASCIVLHAFVATVTFGQQLLEKS